MEFAPTAANSSATSGATPERSMPSTSSCAASTGASSSVRPVTTFSTPAGKSDDDVISPSRTAGVGRFSLARATTVLPTHSGASTASTNPSSEDSCTQTTPTTPLGTGIEKLKNGPATGLVPPSTWAILSVHPAYQTTRSIDAETVF